MKAITTCLSILTALLLPALANAAPGNPGPGDPAERFAQADLDGDGALSATEFEEAGRKRRTEMFDRIDADADGYLTEQEMRNHHQQMRGNRKGQGRGYSQTGGYGKGRGYGPPAEETPAP